MARSSRLWDRMAKRYSRAPIRDEAAYKEKLKVTREYFSPQMQVLEFGCGTGSTALVHAPHVQYYLATDYSAAMLEIARRKAEEQGVDNLSFVQVAFEDLAEPEQSFDMILALNIVHLLEDPFAAVEKVARLLKPGGYFVSSTACLDDNLPLLKYILPPFRMIGLLPLVRFFTAKEFIARVEQSGFDIEREWQPKKGMLFLVARRAGGETESEQNEVADADPQDQAETVVEQPRTD